MREAGHEEQRNDRAVVRQSIHAAGRHGGDAMENLKGNSASFAAAMKSFAMVARAMLIPPDAEPVMPASTDTVIASLTSGFGMARSAWAMRRNPGSEAMTAPKPYSEAVFIAASKAPDTADLVPSANLEATVRKAKIKTVAIPSSNAASTAQIAVTG